MKSLIMDHFKTSQLRLHVCFYAMFFVGCVILAACSIYNSIGITKDANYNIIGLGLVMIFFFCQGVGIALFGDLKNFHSDGWSVITRKELLFSAVVTFAVAATFTQIPWDSEGSPPQFWGVVSVGLWLLGVTTVAVLVKSFFAGMSSNVGESRKPRFVFGTLSTTGIPKLSASSATEQESALIADLSDFLSDIDPK